MQETQGQNVWEKKDLRISKLAIVGRIIENYKPKDWTDKEDELADKMLTYVYKPMNKKQIKEIDEYTKQQSIRATDTAPF